MVKEIVKGKNGYGIPCIKNLKGDEAKIVLISHGLGSSKESPTVLGLAETLPNFGIGTYSYDFPGHGDSPVDGKQFRIINCLNDLEAVETHISEIAPDAEIMYFSSSFGAYLNLIYLATRPHSGQKSFLRCAAVNLPAIFQNDTRPEYLEPLKKQGFFTMDYPRPLKVTQEFCDDLARYDVFSLFKANIAEIAMIHGDGDKTAPVEDALRFAAQFSADITIIKGAGHRFMNPGGRTAVLKAATDFFTKEN